MVSPVRRLTALGFVLGFGYLGCVCACPERPKASSAAPKASHAPTAPLSVPPPAAPTTTFEPAVGTPATPGVNVPAIKVDTVGYPRHWQKLAVFNVDPKGARIVDEAGRVAYTFRAQDIKDRGRDESSQDLVWQADFTALDRPGRYTIEVGSAKSDPFQIGDGLYGEALQAGLKSFYFQRCRTALPEPYAVWDGKAYTRSAPCHVHQDVAWDYATYPAKKQKWQLEGGWHDAGNYEIYIPSAGPSAQALLIAYESHPALFGDDSNIPESHNKTPDVLDEVRWGLDRKSVV